MFTSTVPSSWGEEVCRSSCCFAVHAPVEAAPASSSYLRTFFLPPIHSPQPPPLWCAQVVSSHLKALCSFCSGDLKLQLPAATIRKQLVVFHNIAVFHGFEVLEQLSGWLLQADHTTQPGGEQPPLD